MLELYKRRVKSKGSYIGEVLKNQSDVIMDATFLRDVATKACYINNELVYAKFQKYTTYSISKDVIDYHLQFMTGVHYPEGTYVYIPDDTGMYSPWLIVGRDDDSQFIKYSILKCNWTLWWIHNGKLLSCLGVIISNGISTSVDSDKFTTTVDGNCTVWLPTTNEVQTIGYDARFLITKNKTNPSSFKVTKILDTLPVGITKLGMIQDRYNRSTDKVDLVINGEEVMVADYYASAIEPELPETTPKDKGYSVITHSGTAPTLRIGGSAKTLTATFYDALGVEVPNIVPVWTYDFPKGLENQFVVETTNVANKVKIKALKNYDLLELIVTIKVESEDGLYQSELKMEVTAI